jgi:hypothetical protein
MKDEHRSIERSVAQGAALMLEPLGHKGLIDFLRREIVEEEWKIARAQATIAAYEKAIVTLEARIQPQN